MIEPAATAILANVHYYLRAHGSSWEANLSDAKFIWNRDTPLFEIEIKSADGRQGYLLVSHSESLPFIISRSFNRGLLSSLLRQRLFAITSSEALSLRDVEPIFQYVVPFGFIAHLDEATAVQLDDGIIVLGLGAAVDQAVPSGDLVDNEIAAGWQSLAAGKSTLSDVDEIMWDSGPYYNQAYNSSCVITGCTPVAWATYAAWLKGIGGQLPDLFNASKCWFNDWKSYWRCREPIDECQEVNSLVWWFNQKLGTNNGATPWANIIRGDAVFPTYGSPQITVRQISTDVATMTDTLRRYAVLLSGIREWQFTLSEGEVFGKLVDEPAGHSIVVHGIKNSEISVNMGWGGMAGSLWFNLNSISNRQVLSLFKR